MENTIRQLSGEEKAVARLMCAGHTTKEIAVIRRKSEYTVNAQRRSICEKLGTNRVSIVIKTLIENYELCQLS